MKNKPRIMVFRLKELIYTGIFIVLGILLIILMAYMFRAKKPATPSASEGQITRPVNSVPEAETTTSLSPITVTQNNTSQTEKPQNNDKIDNTQPVPATTDANMYTPGVYTSSLILSNSTMEIQVCVDANHINSISIENMDEAVTTMYPLMENSMNDIANQIVNRQSLENIQYSEDSQYTYIILLDAIETTLNKAKN